MCNTCCCVLQPSYCLCQTGCTGLRDVVFVVDSSGTINENDPQNWNRVRTFVNEIIRRFSIGENAAQVGLVLYSTDVESSFYLNSFSNLNDISNRVLNLPYKDQQTNTAGAIREMSQNQFVPFRGDRQSAPNVAIIITDGRADDSQRAIGEAIAARAAGIRIISVGVTQQVDQNEIRQISSEPQQMNRDWFLSRDFTSLQSIVDAVSRSACGIGGGNPTPPPGEDMLASKKCHHRQLLPSTASYDPIMKCANTFITFELLHHRTPPGHRNNPK